TLLVDQTLARLADNEAALSALAARHGGLDRTGQIIDFHEDPTWPTARTLAAQADRAAAAPDRDGDAAAPLPTPTAPADWLYNGAAIGDAPPGHSFAGQPEQPVDIAEIEQRLGTGTARFQKLIAPGYEHNLTAPQAWQTVGAELSQAASAEPGGAQERRTHSAHGAYAVLAMRFA